MFMFTFVRWILGMLSTGLLWIHVVVFAVFEKVLDVISRYNNKLIIIFNICVIALINLMWEKQG